MKTLLKKLLPDWLNHKIKKNLVGYEHYKVTFSSAGEDIILFNLLQHKLAKNEPGFFIDIGAFHPERSSNTFLFHLNGWKGINIDPRPNSMKEFEKRRPQDINLEIAISNTVGLKPYHMISGAEDENTLSLNYIETLNELGYSLDIKKTIQVQTETLKNILDKHLKKNQKIDFLSVDVEGHEIEVLSSNDWELYRPEIIVIEITGTTIEDILDHTVTKFLISKDYSFLARTIINLPVNSIFFVDQKKK